MLVMERNYYDLELIKILEGHIKNEDFGLMDKNVARKLFNPLFYLPLQLLEKMNKKFAFTVVAK